MSVVRRVLSLDREVEQAEKTSGSVEVCVVGPATGVPTPELEIGLWSLRGASPSVRIPRMHRWVPRSGCENCRSRRILGPSLVSSLTRKLGSDRWATQASAFWNFASE